MREKSKLSDLEILEQLPPHIELRLLTYSFNHYQQPRKKIFDLVRKDYLEMVRRGLYLNLKSHTFKDTPLETLANSLYFPSYISAEWALQFYGVLTERVHSITSVTSRKSILFKTSVGQFEFHHVHKHRYAFGYEVHSQGFMIARPEKALLDYLKLRRHDMQWQSYEEMETFLQQELRLNFSWFLHQVSTENLLEISPYYHRNSREFRILKWMIEKKSSSKESKSG